MPNESETAEIAPNMASDAQPAPPTNDRADPVADASTKITAAAENLLQVIADVRAFGLVVRVPFTEARLLSIGVDERR